MKKLMIAAAVAAMIGGAFATTYDVSLSLKTTVGKYGQQGKRVTNYFYLGANADHSQMWYEDDAVVALIEDDVANNGGYFTWKKINGVSVPGLSAKAKEDYAWLIENFINADIATADKTGKNADGATYGYQSGKKWCDTFTIVIEPGELCYRTAGSMTIKAEWEDDCCLAGGAPTLMNVFGASLYDKCTKAEMYVADWSGFINGIATITDSNKDPRQLTALAVAGQGTFGKVIYAKNDKAYETQAGVTAITGYAVGTADAPLCSSCCVTSLPSATWTCDGQDWNQDTAVFGSFSIKYNATKTKKSL